MTEGEIATRTTSAINESLWYPRLENIRPLPWADFHEMYERRVYEVAESILSRAVGVPHVEGKCLYLDVFYRMHQRPSFPGDGPRDTLRWVLSLPNDLVQYDEANEELWFHHRVHTAGPFSLGKEIMIDDAQWLVDRSPECGNHRILRGSSIESCGYLSDRFTRACTVAIYSSTHRVLPTEANRRLERIPEMEIVLAGLRETESKRTAGWGIDQADPYMRIGESFVAWLWLTGDDPPSPQAQEVAAEHSDIELRIGASVTYAQIQSAQQQFGDGNGIYLPRDTLDGAVQAIELSEAVAWTWINHRANALEIAIDTYRIPHDVGSVMLTGDPNSYGDNRWPPQDELFATIADDIRARIEVPFDIVFQRIDPDERHR
ncbi:hypothetical protein [Candidatus Poriferisodalis sp.]|uniref:hypothetical protein n=1 Tax=Candidatus Poriferisodalis sp. TaxID=3101277 RepID=UPI003B02AB84